jgi:hypothetical protein
MNPIPGRSSATAGSWSPVSPGGPSPGLPPWARPGGRPPQPAPLPHWGWLEWFIVSQTVIPALVFIPGVTSIRVVTRVASFAFALIAWGAIAFSGRGVKTRFAPALWLQGCLAWLALMIFHPHTNSPVSGVASVALYLTVMSPAFWAPAALRTSRQLPRLMTLLFVCNAASALMGLAQAYRPGLNPAHIMALEGGDEIARASLTYETADGRTIIRPCGLTDNPGGAGAPAVQACLFGLCLAIRPVAAWKRLTGLGLGLVGMAVIYYCQARTAMVIEFICLLTLMGLFAWRGNVRQAMLLGVVGGVILVAATVWVISNVGMVGVERFGTLLTSKPGELYHGSRGSFVEKTFTEQIWESPLGDGLGRYGQIHTYFGDHGLPYGVPGGPVWVEVQWPGWGLDGGLPLILGYAVAIALAMRDTLRVVLTSKDRELTYCASIVFAMNLATCGLCFSQCPFIAATGLQFWLLAAVVHTADQQRRTAAAPAPPRSPAGSRPR